jgi:uncharacterized membrane protein YjgN (DUF898 family)
MQNQQQGFSFTGTGSEYFRIWIVNLLLTIVTFGIYSAWAKVKRVQYFYRNTWVNGSSFDYHGSPQAILKGRIIAVVLFGVYKVTLTTMPPLGLAVLAVIMVVLPMLLLMSFQFRLRNTSYRGLHFNFVGTLKAAYLNFLALPVLTGLSLYTMAPFTHQRIKAYQHGNSRFGHTQFSFDAKVLSFYNIYLLTFLMMAIPLGIIGYLGWGYLHTHPYLVANQKAEIGIIIIVAYLSLIVVSLIIVPFYISRMQNLIWNHTRLGPHGFSSSLSARGLLWIVFSNVIATIFTLGLFKPFADIRYARYRVEKMTLLPEGDLEAFVAEEQQSVSATGMEVAELFDFDIGF